MADETNAEPAQFETIILKEMQKGTPKTGIISRLTEAGMSVTDASALVENLYPALFKIGQEEKFEGSLLPLAMVGGVLAAAIGGAVWGALTIFTNTEFGILAWGIGLLCGYGVVWAAKKKKGRPLQIVAVICSALGILIGKYVAFFDAVNGAAKEEGREAFGLFDPQVFEIFTQNLQSLLGAYDLLWVGLAVYTAWYIPKSTGIKV